MKTAFITRIALSIIFVAALASAIGGAVYYFLNLSFWWSITAAVVALASTFAFLPKFFKQSDKNFPKETQTNNPYLAVLPLVYLLAGVCFILLYRSGTATAINSPWPQVPVLFWAAFVLMSTASALIFVRVKNQTILFLAALPICAVALSVAALVYKLGYGFDPFVHRAAEKFILDHGAISPKTPYYAGEYALVVITAALSKLPLRLIDIWLVPTLATLGIVSAFIFSATKTGKNIGLLLIAALAFIPYSFFISTTPFSLACLYVFIAAIFTLATSESKQTKIAVCIFSAAALLTHPMAGVPAIILAALLLFKNRVVRIVLTVLGAIGVPILFLVQGAKLIVNLKNIISLPLPFELPLTRFHPLGDLVYASSIVGFTLIIIFFIIALAQKQPAAKTFGLAALASATGAIITAATVDFSYLPSQEQAWYPARLLMVALLIITPPAIVAFSDFIKKISTRPLFSLTALALLVFLISSNVYLSYPRVDAYALSKGWSVGSSDLSAVLAINADAGSEPYIVLASEPVSAAALEKFGFFKYFKTDKGELFAYPIPLGGELYKYYLKMIYENTSAATMREAMTLAKVKRGYFVMNPYWTGFARISAAARAEADAEIPSGGSDTIFVFKIQ